LNAKLLIDAMVRQTMILIAQLATTAGIRAPLAHVADQVFLELVQGLESQGVSRKVIADMFGLALRSYQLKVKRLSESSTDANRSLWEAVFAYIQSHSLISRAQILSRFCNDDSASVRGILHDLVESNLVFKSGRGPLTHYKAASEDDLGLSLDSDPLRSAEALTWISIYRLGPTSFAALSEHLPLTQDLLNAALRSLLDSGRIQTQPPQSAPFNLFDPAVTYSAQHCVIPMGTPGGWEAAVFDHFQAMVTALCRKLRHIGTVASRNDAIGGSTYSFHIWPDHPYEARVLQLLKETRASVSALRAEVMAHNDAHPQPERGVQRVVFYVGQNVIPNEEDGDD
jgi:hypothetical protein